MIEVQSKKKALLNIVGVLASIFVLVLCIGTISWLSKTVLVSCSSYYTDDGSYYNELQGGTVSLQNTTGTLNASCDIKVGQSVVLNAVQNSGYSFVGFYLSENFEEGSLLTTENPYNFLAGQNQQPIYAKFAKNYAITLQVKNLQNEIEQFNKTFYFGQRIDIVELITEEYGAETAQNYINTIATLSSGEAPNGLDLSAQTITVGAGDSTISIQPSPVLITITQGMGTTLTIKNANNPSIIYANGDLLDYGTTITPYVVASEGYENPIISLTQSTTQIMESGSTYIVNAPIVLNSTATLKAYNLTTSPFTNAIISFETDNQAINNVLASNSNQTRENIKHFTNLTITLTPVVGYKITNFAVVMGDATQTISIIDGIGTCIIASVTGEIEISSINTILQTYNLTITDQTNSNVEILNENLESISTGTDVLTFGNSITITALSRLGYTFETLFVLMGGTAQTISIVDNEGTCNIANVSGDVAITAISTPNTNTPYTLRHYQEKIGNNLPLSALTCDLFQTENRTGITDLEVSPTPKNYTGFSSPSAQTITILADGTAEINYFYTRNSYEITLTKGAGISTVNANGEYVSGTEIYTAEFGAEFTISASVDTGYYFINWTNSDTTEFSILKNYSGKMLAQNLNLTANAEQNGPFELIYSQETVNRTATVTGFTGENVIELIIPEKVVIGSIEYTITAIADNAFENTESLKRVVFSNFIKTIGSYAFNDCTNLSQIEISSSITSVGVCAFGDAEIFWKKERTVTLNNSTIARYVIENSDFKDESNPDYDDFGNLLVGATTIYVKDDISEVSDYISNLQIVNTDKQGYTKYIKN